MDTRGGGSSSGAELARLFARVGRPAGLGVGGSTAAGLGLADDLPGSAVARHACLRRPFVGAHL